jgi:hypothetical protein
MCSNRVGFGWQGEAISSTSRFSTAVLPWTLLELSEKLQGHPLVRGTSLSFLFVYVFLMICLIPFLDLRSICSFNVLVSGDHRVRDCWCLGSHLSRGVVCCRDGELAMPRATPWSSRVSRRPICSFRCAWWFFGRAFLIIDCDTVLLTAGGIGAVGAVDEARFVGLAFVAWVQIWKGGNCVFY